MKKILLILVALLTIGYLLFSANYFKKLALSKECESFEVFVADSANTQFVRTDDIEKLVKKYGLYPVGKTFSEINTLAIHDTILTNQLVESAEVYTTSGMELLFKLAKADFESDLQSRGQFLY